MPRTRGFQSTRPIRGATLNAIVGFIFNTLFQSTRPIRGATGKKTQYHLPRINFNPRAPYGARLIWDNRDFKHMDISIHAPHTGRDPRASRKTETGARISIHAPHTGRDSRLMLVPHQTYQFQSTRPIRGATSKFTKDENANKISIHAPHTGRDK